ncbi:NIPSNAP family protein [Adhaeretor mobilis]|uniref:NIPSNAP domain-containing protein n=1 Tax=Adhaeretor mobilis TaxID=1930276 RepID=A0A517N073_9BACT|nr:NIPSNAP family protein [Adhaeretor mobilis]QDT00537.1 hypothetical protein HG15A2_38750 [Adhaeretor mobilis]
MLRPLLFLFALVTLTSATFAQEKEDAAKKQFLELRTYTLVDAAAEEKLDAYLEKALLPALERQGLGPNVAFDQAGESESIEVMLLIAGQSAEAVTTATAKLAKDDTYQLAAKAYHSTPSDKPLVKRIRSELLQSFDVWPQAIVSQYVKKGRAQLFELRTYESATERLGQLKVEMFNSGEVPIFLECNVMPVFMGQALIGDKLPNLTYMTVHDDAKTRDANWAKFVQHPDWKAYSKVKKYAGTVSKIHKSDWVAKPYSQL